MATRLTLPWERIPAEWSPQTAKAIQQDFEALKAAVTTLQGQAASIIDIQGTPGPRGVQGFPGPDGEDGHDGYDGLPGPPGPQGPQGPQGPAGSGTGGGGPQVTLPDDTYNDAIEEAMDLALFPPIAAGPQGPQGPTGPTGPTGPAGPAGGGGGLTVPLSFPDSFVDDALEEIMNEALIPPPGFSIGTQTQSATVSWGTPTVLAFGVNFTQTTDGVILLYNSVSQSGTLALGGTTVGGVNTDQSDTAMFAYKAGTTANITAGGAGSGLLAWYFPFTGGCGWGTSTTPTVGSNFTETSDGIILLYVTGTAVATYTLNSQVYGRVNGAGDTAFFPYKNGQTALISITSGSGLTATFFPFTLNGSWGTPVSLSTAVDFTETASGLIIMDNSGNQGSLGLLNASAYGGCNNGVVDTGMIPYTVGQTAHINVVGGSGLACWFFPLPSAGSSSGTTITGGNFSTNVTSVTAGTPVVFADSSGRLGTSTLNRLVLAGTGNPQGVVAAALGYEYVDTSTGYSYAKLGGGSTAYGWYRICTPGAGFAGMTTWQAYVRPAAAVSANVANANCYGVFDPGLGASTFTQTGISSSAFSTISSKLYVTGTTAATSGTAGFIGNFGNAADWPMLDDDLDLWAEIVTGAITSVRYWFGITSASMTNTDTLASASTGGGLLFRFSTVAGDGGWVGYTAPGASGTTHVSATVAAIAATTTYKLRIRFVRQGTPTVYFSVNDGTEIAMTANLPATGARYFLNWGLIPQSNTALTFGWRSWGAVIGS